jgi:hypothetical protein
MKSKTLSIMGLVIVLFVTGCAPSSRYVPIADDRAKVTFQGAEPVIEMGRERYEIGAFGQKAGDIFPQGSEADIMAEEAASSGKLSMAGFVVGLIGFAASMVMIETMEPGRDADAMIGGTMLGAIGAMLLGAIPAVNSRVRLFDAINRHNDTLVEMKQTVPVAAPNPWGGAEHPAKPPVEPSAEPPADADQATTGDQ